MLELMCVTFTTPIQSPLHICKFTTTTPNQKFLLKSFLWFIFTVQDTHRCCACKDRYPHYLLVKYLRSIQTSYCILSISGILKFNKSKSWGISGYPHIPQRAIFAKCRFNLVFRCTASQITNIHFAREIPFTITWHSDESLWKKKQSDDEVKWYQEVA